MRFLVTGTAGFIGFHVAKRLIAAGHDVVGIDGMTPYYDVALKRRRHAILLQSAQFSARELMLEDAERLAEVYTEFRPDVVIHLAAQAGVRYSLENPGAYISANIVGTFNILELARNQAPQHLLLASTSSVYGANTKMPFEESDRTDHPLTLYAATKKATKSMAHAYAHLWKIPTTVFRFFSVYGPWGRPDMALFKFTKAILAGEPIDVYNYGDMDRDFTYVDDIANAITLLVDAVPGSPAPAHDSDDNLGLSPAAPFRVVNIGNGNPVAAAWRSSTRSKQASAGRRSGIICRCNPAMSRQPLADTSLLRRLTGFQPATPVSSGVDRFVAWYRDYYRV